MIGHLDHLNTCLLPSLDLPIGAHSGKKPDTIKRRIKSFFDAAIKSVCGPIKMIASQPVSFSSRSKKTI